jgi:hypothetical protein
MILAVLVDPQLAHSIQRSGRGHAPCARQIKTNYPTAKYEAIALPSNTLSFSSNSQERLPILMPQAFLTIAILSV